jgi:hypothetical protein
LIFFRELDAKTEEMREKREMRSKKMKKGFKDKIESSSGARAAFT